MRLLTLLGALLFLFSRTGEALGALACPHHGSPGAASPIEHGSPVAGYAHPGGAEHPAAEQTAPSEHAGPCTCAGPCHVSGSGLLTDAPLRRSLDLLMVRREIAHFASEHARQTLLPFFHPYATAPPPSA